MMVALCQSALTLLIELYCLQQSQCNVQSQTPLSNRQEIKPYRRHQKYVGHRLRQVRSPSLPVEMLRPAARLATVAALRVFHNCWVC